MVSRRSGAFLSGAPSSPAAPASSSSAATAAAAAAAATTAAASSMSSSGLAGGRPRAPSAPVPMSSSSLFSSLIGRSSASPSSSTVSSAFSPANLPASTSTWAFRRFVPAAVDDSEVSPSSPPPITRQRAASACAELAFSTLDSPLIDLTLPRTLSAISTATTCASTPCASPDPVDDLTRSRPASQSSYAQSLSPCPSTTRTDTSATDDVSATASKHAADAPETPNAPALPVGLTTKRSRPASLSSRKTPISARRTPEPTACAAAGVRTFHDDYEELEVLGSGTFSTVRRCRHLTSGEERAVKIIHRRKLAHASGTEEMVMREIAILQQVHHESVVRLFDVYIEPQSVYIVTELASGGELFDLVLAHERLDADCARAVMRQLLSGLAALHTAGIVHRDIKPENMLITHIDQIGIPQIKIADFGCGTFVGDGSTVNTFVGSPQYCAPEILAARSNARTYGTAVDVWSAGVVAFVLLAGYLPFADDEEGSTTWETRVASGKAFFHASTWASVPAVAKDLVLRMLTVNSTLRPSAAECLRHPWLSTPTLTSRTLQAPETREADDIFQAVLPKLSDPTLESLHADVTVALDFEEHASVPVLAALAASRRALPELRGLVTAAIQLFNDSRRAMAGDYDMLASYLDHVAVSASTLASQVEEHCKSARVVATSEAAKEAIRLLSRWWRSLGAMLGMVAQQSPHLADSLLACAADGDVDACAPGHSVLWFWSALRLVLS